MARFILLGAGAGLVSAALFASAATGTALAGISVPISRPCRSALPGSAGAGRRRALPRSRERSWPAACSGSPLAPSSAAPSLCRFRVLCYLALLSRPVAATQGQQASLEWYPIGRLVGWAAIIAGVLAGIMVLMLGYDVDTYRESIKDLLQHAVP